MATVLSAEQLASALAELPSWSGDPSGISRTVIFRLATHTAGGVTETDLSLARSINTLTDNTE
jgi:pterin-4a-carbinolamine dehydratase